MKKFQLKGAFLDHTEITKRKISYSFYIHIVTIVEMINQNWPTVKSNRSLGSWIMCRHSKNSFGNHLLLAIFLWSEAGPQICNADLQNLEGDRL